MPESQHRRVAVNLMGVDELDERGFAGLLESASIADELGVDVLVFPDHLALSETAHAERAGFPYPISVAWFEPVAALAAVAAATTRSRLGTSVLVAPLRPPVLLAKQLATLDAISGGRLEVVMGIGWQEAEFNANGSEFRDRFGTLEEQIAICRALWAGGPASHAGPRWSFTDLHSYPLPPQGPQMPLALGGRLTKTHADRIVRIADGWAPAPLPVAEVQAGIELLAEVAAAQGRDARELTVTATVPLVPHEMTAAEAGAPHPVAEAVRLWDAGADVVLVHPRAFCTSVSDLPGFLAPLLEARDA